MAIRPKLRPWATKPLSASSCSVVQPMFRFLVRSLVLYLLSDAVNHRTCELPCEWSPAAPDRFMTKLLIRVVKKRTQEFYLARTEVHYASRHAALGFGLFHFPSHCAEVSLRTLSLHRSHSNISQEMPLAPHWNSCSLRGRQPH